MSTPSFDPPSHTAEPAERPADTDTRSNPTTGGQTADSEESSHPVAGPPGYELLEEVGRGGMGVVYWARDLTLGRDVAVKLLSDKYTSDSPAARRFLDEARITAQLQHPGIPPVHQVGALPGGRPFLAMKLIKGRTFDALLGDRPDPAADRGRLLAVFEQACQAVGYAHAHGVIHRDLKPANVMVGAFGEVQVMDWGLAKVLTGRGHEGPGTASEEIPAPDADPERTTDHRAAADPTDDRTQAGQVMGTPAYMPPEQARGEVERVDRRADVFALGGVLCATLTGKPPYVRRGGGDVVRQAAAGELQDALARLDGCGADAALVALCRRCLSPDPIDRPADAGEVAVEVAEYRVGIERRLRAAERDRAAAQARTVEQRKKRRVQLALAAAVGLLLIGGGAFAWWQDSQAAQKQFENERRGAEERSRLTRNTDALAELVGRCEEGLRESDVDRAAVALGQIDRRLPEGGGEAMTDRVARCRADLAMLRELDWIDTFRWTTVESKLPDPKSVAARWRAAFEEYGVAAEVIPANEAAGLVARSLVRDRLLTALDLWLIFDPSPSVRAVLRAADPDSYREAVRDAVAAQAHERTIELAGRAEALTQPPRFAAALGRHPAVTAERQREVLGAALRSRPWDLALLIALGNSYPDFQREMAPEQVRWFQAAVAAHPRSAIAHHNLGVALRSKGDLDGAFECFQEAVRLDPKYARGHLNLGFALNAKGDLDRAIAAYREAVRLDPKDARAHHFLGNALRTKRDLNGAIAAYREAVRLDPKSAICHSNLGEALENRGDRSGAITFYREAIRLDPKFVHAHLNLGVALKDKADLNGAIACYKEAIRLDPRFALAHYNLGVALRLKRDLDGAIAAYREAIRLDPKLTSAHLNLGNALWVKGDPHGAVACYREAIRLDAKHVSAHNNLARLLAVGSDGVRDGRRAVELATRACDLTGWKTPSYIDTLAAAHAEAGDFAKAVEYQKQALSFPAFERTNDGAEARRRLALYARETPYRDPSLATTRPREVAPPPRSVPRRPTLDRLTADLTAWRKRLAADPAKNRDVVHHAMTLWLTDPDLASVRVRAELEKLPLDARVGWFKLWTEVRELRDATAPPEVAPPPRSAE